MAARGTSNPKVDRRQDRGGPARWKVEVVQTVSLAVLGLAAALLTVVLDDRDDDLLVLRTLAVAVLAFLPGWLYVRFTVYRAAAVWDEYVLHLHRLGIDEPGNLPEPLPSSPYHSQWEEDRRHLRIAEDTPGDPRSIYRQKFEAYYGKDSARDPSDRSDARRGGADAFFPALLTTAILAVGWSAVLSGGPVLSLGGTLADALRFGFMGAYSFILQMLIRRFFQSDLRPSAYISASVRIVSVLILVAVLHQWWDAGDYSPKAEATVAFVVGFFPLMGMQALQRLAARLLKVTVKSLDVPYPLSDLDGLNIWNESRLLEEGIEDMQNLTTANLVDVMLHTRVPVGRLVDWVDQAHLYLHLPPSQGKESDAGPRTKLRLHGIRTATDLEDAFRRCAERDDTDPTGVVGVPDPENQELLTGLRWVLNEAANDGPSVTQTILKTFEAEPNLDHVRHWKRSWRREFGRGGRDGTRSSAAPAAVTAA